MPTAPRLIAAICLAFLGWFVSGMIIPLLPDGTKIGWFVWVNTGIGVLVGWKVMGPRVGTGGITGFGIGLTGMVALVFWGLLIHSLVEMIYQSLKMRYEGPMDALVGMIGISLGFVRIMATPEVIVTLLVGGLLAGLLTQWSGRRWS
jgi:hypothetical protein